MTVSFGGVDFVPGQRLHSDDDGILVTRALATPGQPAPSRA